MDISKPVNLQFITTSKNIISYFDIYKQSKRRNPLNTKVYDKQSGQKVKEFKISIRIQAV